MADQIGPTAEATTGMSARLHELFGVGLDTSNMSAILVVGAVLLLAALSKSFGGLTVSVN